MHSRSFYRSVLNGSLIILVSCSDAASITQDTDAPQTPIAPQTETPQTTAPIETDDLPSSPNNTLFYISPSSSEALCLGAQDGLKSDNTPVVLGRCDGSAAQAWQQSDGALRLYGAKCLTTTSSEKSRDINLQISDCAIDDAGQRFTRTQAGLQLVNTAKCLSYVDSDAAAAAALQLQDCADVSAVKKWNFGAPTASPVKQDTQPDPSAPLVENMTGLLASRMDPMACLHHPGLLESSGKNLAQMYLCMEDDTQPMTYGKNGILMDPQHSRCLTADGGTSTAVNGQKVVAFSACVQGDLSQQWEYASGTWRNKKTQQCLDLFSSRSLNSARLHLADCTGSVSQLWSTPTSFASLLPDTLATAKTLKERCNPRVVTTFNMDDANTQKFKRAFPNIDTLVKQAAIDVCNTIFTAPSQVSKNRSSIRVHIAWNTDGVAEVWDYALLLNGRYFMSNGNENNPNELNGVLHHEITHFYQDDRVGTPGWLIEGMADFVRYKTGYLPLSSRQKGGAYTDSYRVTAFFLVYVDDHYPNFIKDLQSTMHTPAPRWDGTFFQKKTGKSVDQLWRDYQNSF